MPDLPLTDSDAGVAAAFADIIDGRWPEDRIAAFLTDLRQLPLRAALLTAAVCALRRRMVPLDLDFPVLDNCGTGGDRQSTLNISTAAALVLAAAGVKVAKHGNRAVSGSSGSSDVLAALGVRVDLPAAAVKTCLEQTNLGFCFAPRFHPALQTLAPIRRRLGVPTIFNLLGPLANPARPAYQLAGVGLPEALDAMAAALLELGIRRGAIVHGHPRIDEVSLEGPTQVRWIESGQITALTWTPDDFALPAARLDELRCAAPAESASRILAVLQGGTDPARNWIIANAAAALRVAGRVESLGEGSRLAAETIDSGRALQTLERLKTLSQRDG